ncbi:MAG TPA: DUF1080 domain-containing protein [Verrucomicrobiae bacterium]|nr:DUF1080 domain-containing protein [Verrucomicrobiae bacterium]
MKRTRILIVPVVSVALATVARDASAADRKFYGDPPDETHAWCVHDLNRPQPPIVKPGDAPGQPPADAIVLFDGKNLDEWVSVEKKGGGVIPAQWAVKDGFMEVVPKTGILRTKKEFGACQLHIEWATPSVVEGESQGRGNSGVFFMGKYELQVLDCHNNVTYADGGAGSVYGQNPPQVNVCRPPGQWQTYDVIFHPTRFDEAGNVIEPGTITAFQNGALVQDHWVYEGLGGHRARAKFAKHGEKGPLELQDHNNPTRFRNIWIRELASNAKPTREQVAKQRQEIAAKLRAEAGQAKDPLAEMKLWLESLVYAEDSATVVKAQKMASEYADSASKLDDAAAKAREGELLEMRSVFKYMNDNKLPGSPYAAQQKIEGFLKAKGVKFK